MERAASRSPEQAALDALQAWSLRSQHLNTANRSKNTDPKHCSSEDEEQRPAPQRGVLTGTHQAAATKPDHPDPLGRTKGPRPASCHPELLRAVAKHHPCLQWE